MAIFALLDFGSGFDALLLQKTGKGAWGAASHALWLLPAWRGRQGSLAGGACCSARPWQLRAGLARRAGWGHAQQHCCGGQARAAAWLRRNRRRPCRARCRRARDGAVRPARHAGGGRLADAPTLACCRVPSVRTDARETAQFGLLGTPMASRSPARASLSLHPPQTRARRRSLACWAC